MGSGVCGVWRLTRVMNCGHLFARARLDRRTNQDRHNPTDDDPQKEHDEGHCEYHLSLREDSAAADARAKWYGGFNQASSAVLGLRIWACIHPPTGGGITSQRIAGAGTSRAICFDNGSELEPI